MNAKVSAYGVVILVVAAAAFGIERQLPKPVSFSYRGQQVPRADRNGLERSIRGALPVSRKGHLTVTITDREVAVVNAATPQAAQSR